MAKFVIIRGKNAALSVQDDIELIFEAESIEAARKRAVAYLMGGGLPYAGDIDDHFTLYVVSSVPGCATTSEALWRAYIASGLNAAKS